MAQTFPPWTNRLPGWIAGAIAAIATASVFGAWFFFSPSFTDVGYSPHQPLPFSHRLHAGELEVDCRYCHLTVESGAIAGVPPTQVCMNCHELVGRGLESLEPLRLSAATGEPIRWIRVHKVPDYTFFDHHAHLQAGLACESCHGEVSQMERLQQMEPLSMLWCLDCHRHPERHLGVAINREINPPNDCSACHR